LAILVVLLVGWHSDNYEERDWPDDGCPDSCTPNFARRLQLLNSRDFFWGALVRTLARLARAPLSPAPIEWPRPARTGRLTYKSKATTIGDLTPDSAWVYLSNDASALP
jgi:hypothetical protein